ncbi:hypothetical protein RQP46_003922 [Phenoliferia psychrophenolica]
MNESENSLSNAEKGHQGHGDLGGAALRHAVTPGGHSLDTTQPAFPVYHRKLANPAPLGLAAFSTTTFLLVSECVGPCAFRPTLLNILLTPTTSVVYGGIVQIIAGIFEFFCGNTFGCTVFTSYGAFWISFAMIISPWSGIAAAFDDPAEFQRAIGFFLLSWLVFTVIVFFASLRSSISLVATIFWLMWAFSFLAAGEFRPDLPILHKLGGVFGIITAMCGYWTMAAGLLTPETAYFLVPSGSLARRD